MISSSALSEADVRVRNLLERKRGEKLESLGEGSV